MKDQIPKENSHSASIAPVHCDASLPTGEPEMFRFTCFADKSPIITLLRGRISTFERIRKRDPAFNTYDFNDGLSIGTDDREKMLEVWACPIQSVSGWR